MKIDGEKPNELSYEDIKEGMVFEFKRTITDDDMLKFADLTGDRNPLHISSEYASSKGFKDRVVYGMLTSSLFSALVGMHCPGKSSLYVSQNLEFRSYIIPSQEVTVRGEVLKKYDSIKTILMKTVIACEGKIIVSGEAKVKII